MKFISFHTVWGKHFQLNIIKTKTLENFEKIGGLIISDGAVH